jgi:hypothetical protein
MQKIDRGRGCTNADAEYHNHVNHILIKAEPSTSATVITTH